MAKHGATLHAGGLGDGIHRDLVPVARRGDQLAKRRKDALARRLGLFVTQGRAVAAAGGWTLDNSTVT